MGVDAYQRDDIHGYEKILQSNTDLLSDPFIAENIDEVTRNMRTKAVLKLVAPYTRFTLEFVSKQLKISLTEAQDILGFLIVDKKLHGKMDQQAGTVEVETQIRRQGQGQHSRQAGRLGFEGMKRRMTYRSGFSMQQCCVSGYRKARPRDWREALLLQAHQVTNRAVATLQLAT